MGLLLVIAVVVGILILIEVFKHHFTKSLLKYFIILGILVLTLLIASAYIDFGTLIGQGSTFSQTGHVIVDGVSSDVKDIDITHSETLSTISEKTKDFFQNLLDN